MSETREKKSLDAFGHPKSRQRNNSLYSGQTQQKNSLWMHMTVQKGGKVRTHTIPVYQSDATENIHFGCI